MERQCNDTCNSVEAAMYNIYELTNKSVEEKLQELSTVLERIGMQNKRHDIVQCLISTKFILFTAAKLEVELEDFKTALSALYTDVHSQDQAVQ